MSSDAVAIDQLTELGHVPTVRDYLAELWGRREFAIYVPFQDLRSQKIDTILGQVWHFLDPVLSIAVYYVIFGVMLEIDRGIDNYVGFLVIGVLAFTVSQRVTTDAVNAMSRDEGLIRSVQFPRALLPITAVTGQTMAFGPALVVLFGALVLTGETPSLKWLLVVVPFVAHIAINLGIAFLAARAGYSVRDLGQVVQHVFRLLFYLSAVLFLPELFVEDETLIRLFAINPLYDVLMVYRWVLMDLPIEAEIPIALAIWAVVLPVAGFVFFIRAEHKYGS